MPTFKRVCQICGEEFDSKSPMKKCCYKDHIQICPDCGTPVVWNKVEPFRGCKPCIYKRANAKRRDTYMKMYGVGTIFETQFFKDKTKETVRAKYGVDYIGQSEEAKAKSKATCLAKYGVDTPTKLPEIKQVIQEKRTLKKEQIAEKTKQTCLERYGVTNPMYVPEIVNKIGDTMEARYGVRSSVCVPEFKQKMIDTNMKRYGVKFGVQLPQCKDKLKGKKSMTNMRFGEELSSLGFKPEYEYELDGKSYDIFLSDINVLLEVDPTYTHNIKGNHWVRDGLDINYHVEKTAIAESAGFRCIHIFDWDNTNMVISLIQQHQKIYARNCDIRVITVNQANEFLSKYHLQGACSDATIAVGLFYSKELVQVMTFGKSRYTDNYVWELLRFCTIPKYQVVGGVSKLFKYSVNQYHLSSIITYCDRAKFVGRVYEQIGMKFQCISLPAIHWSKRQDHISDALLKQEGFNKLFNANYDNSISDSELMQKNGWFPVYDCGTAIYTYGSDVVVDSQVESIDYDSVLKQRQARLENKTCAYCGKKFRPKSNVQIYCDGPHYQTCPVCGKESLVLNNDKLKYPPTACSYACRQVRTTLTCMSKYGVTSPGALSKGTHYKKHKRTNKSE